MFLCFISTEFSIFEKELNEIRSQKMNQSNNIIRNIILSGLLLFLLSGRTLGQQTYPTLKAILIVGHQEDGTSSAINEMNSIAGVFEQYGIQVYKFYDSKANWSEIKSTSQNCNFLVYSGHGSTMGENGEAGGLCINPRVSTAQLLSELKLKPNSLIIFKSVCQGAGSSAGDDGDIGLSEALKRVTSYSNPFFKIGASAYYANNFGGGVSGFLKNFLAKQDFQTCFSISAQKWTEIECDKPFSKDSSKNIGIASSEGGGTSTVTTYRNGVKTVEQREAPKQYDIAYVGAPSYNINLMLGSTK
jgi:hypothetical protein